MLKDRATIICTRPGKILLVARDEGERWCLPGGIIRHNETALLAARRELEEETAMRANGLQFLFLFGGLRKNHHVFHVAVPAGVIVRPCHEIVACRWLGVGTPCRLTMSVPMREIMGLFLRRSYATTPVVPPEADVTELDRISPGA